MGDADGFTGVGGVGNNELLPVGCYFGKNCVRMLIRGSMEFYDTIDTTWGAYILQELACEAGEDEGISCEK